MFSLLLLPVQMLRRTVNLLVIFFQEFSVFFLSTISDSWLVESNDLATRHTISRNPNLLKKSVSVTVELWGLEPWKLSLAVSLWFTRTDIHTTTHSVTGTV